jgi:hypothetical protein
MTLESGSADPAEGARYRQAEAPRPARNLSGTDDSGGVIAVQGF